MKKLFTFLLAMALMTVVLFGATRASKMDNTTGTTPYNVTIGDIGGDGKPELVVANQVSNTVSVLRNSTPNTWVLPHTIETISTLINDAIENKVKVVVIPKGVYRGNTGNTFFLLLKNVSDLKIIADSVTMICEKRVRALEFQNCKNVTLQGLTIDYDPLPFTQGDIVAVGNDYIDVKIHKGYPVEAFFRVDVIDKQTRFRKRGSVRVWKNSAKIIGSDIVRITNGDHPNLTSVAEVGDMATMSGLADHGAVHALQLSDCQGGMVLKNVTVNTGPGFGIFEARGIGGTILDGCKISRGPKPTGAIEERLRTTIWDGIVHNRTNIGPVVQNCTVEGAGDDSWSVSSINYEIINASGNTITVTPVGLQVGDSLRTSLTSESVVITNNTGGVLTLNKPCPWGVKTRLFSPSRRCEHFIFRNNNIHNAGRILVKSGHGVIENNILDNSKLIVNTELGNGGATGIDSLIIRNNLIIGTGHFMSGPHIAPAGAISIVDVSNGKIKPAGSFNNVLIEKNIFKDVSGVNIVVTSSSNVNIKGNKFYETGMTTPNVIGQDYNISQNTVVYMNNCNKLTLDSNIVYKLGLSSLQERYSVTKYIPKRGEIFEAIEPDPLGKLLIKVIGVPNAKIAIRGDTLYDRIIDGYLFNEFELGTKHKITITPQKDGYTFVPASYQLSELLGYNTLSFLAVPDNITTTNTWTGATNTDWNAPTNWSKGTVPIATENVPIANITNQPYISLCTPIVCNNLLIQSGALLTIYPAKALTVNGILRNNSTGGIVIQSNSSGTGSLISDSTSGTGSTITQRHITASEWHMVSSPAREQNMCDVEIRTPHYGYSERLQEIHTVIHSLVH